MSLSAGKKVAKSFLYSWIVLAIFKDFFPASVMYFCPFLLTSPYPEFLPLQATLFLSRPPLLCPHPCCHSFPLLLIPPKPPPFLLSFPPPSLRSFAFLISLLLLPLYGAFLTVFPDPEPPLFPFRSSPHSPLSTYLFSTILHFSFSFLLFLLQYSS